MTIAEELRAWRGRENLSQSQAARRLGIVTKTLQNWEQGVRAPRGFALLSLRKIVAARANQKGLRARLQP